MTHLENQYAKLPDRFYSKSMPEQVPNPDIILFNSALAKDLNLTSWQDRADILSGNTLPEGADPLAQVYAAHQFGGWVPRLGDGRALLLGEVKTPEGIFDIQLKGAGRTAYSRNGDGRAWVGPVLREYIISEFMAAMDVPTTRALAATATGTRVQRERSFPGAVLTRVASSHVRVGTFQYFTAKGDMDAVKLLMDFVRERHYPDASSTLDLYAAIIAAQAKLIAKWMGLGFVHGVMNTDNMAVSGETLDYGPCAFIDHFSPQSCFSSIDHHGRYAFDQQRNIAGWNLAQLGSCFVSQLSKELGSQDAAIESLTEQLNQFPEIFDTHWVEIFGAKLGIEDPKKTDTALIQGFLDLLHTHSADFTNSFASLGTQDLMQHLPSSSEFAKWHEVWLARISKQEQEETTERMIKANPRIIPRTHQLEAAIQAAVNGDYAPAQRLSRALSSPLFCAEDDQNLTLAPLRDEIVPHTFCGT